MNDLEPRASPDAEVDDERGEDEDAGRRGELPAQWYAIPLWRLFLFSLLGGAIYQFHWMYRCWAAHRASMGYSAQQRFLARYDATGFRVSPFWRSALGIYSYTWLAVVRREAKLAGVPGFGPASVWFALHVIAAAVLPLGWKALLLALVFLPAQLAVNRLQARATGSRVREPITGGELCWLFIGVVITVTAALKARAA